MNKALILYSTTDGHTIKICHRIKMELEKAGHEVRLLPLADAGQAELSESDKVIIGASVRYGKHKQEVIDFISAHQPVLERKIGAFFSVNVVARKATRNTPDTNPYLQKFLSQISWQPDELAVFAGKINYRKYRLLDRLMIRFIMLLTRGPTDPDTNIDFTNWDEVEKFAQIMAAFKPEKQ